MKTLFVKPLVSILLVSLYYYSAEAQNQNNNMIWYFGDHAGLDFHGGAPMVITNGAMYGWDMTSTACDNQGNLVMYCNGDTVWNRNHQPMPHGTGLMGNISGGQCAMIVKQPGAERYYIFTVPEFASGNGCRYSLIDMALDSGRGDVDTAEKNVLLFSGSTEKLNAVYDGVMNTCWIITHEWNNTRFHCFRIDTAGLGTISLVNQIGSIHSGGVYGFDHNAMGQLAISPDGTHLACAKELDGTVELFDFNISTGAITNPILISGYPRALGLAFSPNSQRLYLTQLFDDPITQFDLVNYNATDIANSAMQVGTVTSSGQQPGYTAGYLQLGPDNKIYVAHIVDSVLGAITLPDTPGLGCNYVDHFINLAGKVSEPGLSQGPVFVNTLTGIAKIPTIQMAGYPNPVTGKFHFQIPPGIRSMKVQLFSAEGTFMKEIELKEGVSSFDCDGLVAGVYLLRCWNKNIFMGMQKLIVQ